MWQRKTHSKHQQPADDDCTPWFEQRQKGNRDDIQWLYTVHSTEDAMQEKLKQWLTWTRLLLWVLAERCGSYWLTSHWMESSKQKKTHHIFRPKGNNYKGKIKSLNTLVFRLTLWSLRGNCVFRSSSLCEDKGQGQTQSSTPRARGVSSSLWGAEETWVLNHLSKMNIHIKQKSNK